MPTLYAWESRLDGEPPASRIARGVAGRRRVARRVPRGSGGDQAQRTRFA